MGEPTFVVFKWSVSNSSLMQRTQLRPRLRHTASSARVAVLLRQPRRQPSKQKQIVSTKKLKEKFVQNEWRKRNWKIFEIFYMMRRIGASKRMLQQHVKIVVSR